MITARDARIGDYKGILAVIGETFDVRCVHFGGFPGVVTAVPRIIHYHSSVVYRLDGMCASEGIAVRLDSITGESRRAEMGLHGVSMCGLG